MPKYSDLLKETTKQVQEETQPTVSPSVPVAKPPSQPTQRLKKSSVLKEILLLEVSSEQAKKGILEGVFQKGDTPNANRRIYPMEYLLREMERLAPLCTERALVGELDHPFYPDEAESAVIHAGGVCHVIPQLWQDNKFIYGKSEILNTPNGLILREFIDKKIQIGVSSRSMGNAVEHADGFYYVDNSLKIITWDHVVGPSVVESRMNLVEVQRDWNRLMKEAKTVATKNIQQQKEKSDELDPDEARYHIRKVLKKYGF